jgi:hypothetical protein
LLYVNEDFDNQFNAVQKEEEMMPERNVISSVGDYDVSNGPDYMKNEWPFARPEFQPSVPFRSQMNNGPVKLQATTKFSPGTILIEPAK